ncbi:hypothetical protein DFH05DRAFT_1464489 [Lentinula detonsa]|uniref:Uncharacterized protein n=1 Tax=Lentinula detonsa TaxID=2804962 RepID=A0A9W8NQ22_9AGAR|nr:hypothetical protein DFH05DRAFT_1464489 [Lentinula detonsa]
MNVAESQVDNQCTQKSSRISSYLGPARPPTVRRSSTLSLPGVEALPEPENDPNDDSTELWDEDVDELLSDEMVGCSLGRQSDKGSTGNDLHGSSTSTTNSFQKLSSDAEVRSKSHQMKTSTIISKTNKFLSPNMTARVSYQQEALEDRFQYPASPQNPVIIESDTDDVDESGDVAELCLPRTTSRDKPELFTSPAYYAYSQYAYDLVESNLSPEGTWDSEDAF